MALGSHLGADPLTIYSFCSTVTPMSTVIYSENLGASGEEEESIICKILSEHDVRFTETPLTAETTAEFAEAEAISLLINSQVNAATLAQLPNLRALATRTSGTDHMDFEALRSSRIRTASIPTFAVDGITERVFEFSDLADGKLTSIPHELHREPQARLELPYILKNKRIGIVGHGRAGQHLANELSCLGAKPDNLRSFNPRYSVARNDQGMHYHNQWREFLQSCDVVSFHCPLTPETRHMFNVEDLESCNNDLVIFNTSRGEVVANEALVEGLKTGKIAFAGCDVLEGLRVDYGKKCASYVNFDSLPEGIQAHHRSGRLMLTPHTAGITTSMLRHIARTSATQIKQLLAN